MLCSVTFLSAAPIRVTWNAGGYALASPPVFQTKGLQKQGTVIVRLELSPQGAVKQTKVIAGDADLRSIVIDSARNWRFTQVPDLPATLQAYVYFVEDDGTRWGPPPPPPPPPFGAAVSSIGIEGLPNADRERLLQAIGIKVGDPVTEASFTKARNEARKFTPSMSLRMSLGASGNLHLQFEPTPR
jgi:Gram-negative bacterial TonB protein C-terminal